MTVHAPGWLLCSQALLGQQSIVVRAENYNALLQAVVARSAYLEVYLIIYRREGHLTIGVEQQSTYTTNGHT